MYLHIGHDTMLDTHSIIAILSKTVIEHSPEVRQMIHRYSSGGILQRDLDEAKSLIVTHHGVVLSNISPATLHKRAERNLSQGGATSVWYTEI